MSECLLDPQISFTLTYHRTKQFYVLGPDLIVVTSINQTRI